MTSGKFSHGASISNRFKQIVFGILCIALGCANVGCNVPSSFGVINVQAPTPRVDAGLSRKDLGPISLLDVGLPADQGVEFPGPAVEWNERILMLDLEMRGQSSWTGLLADLTSLGAQVTYRRHYPHVTAADVQGEFGAIIVAAGTGPGGPVPMMRPESSDLLANFIGRGGAALMLTTGGWRDAAKGSNDTYRFNGVLERTHVRARIESNTIVGDVFVPEGEAPPLHVSRPWAYVTGLEWNLASPVAFPTAQVADDVGHEAFAGGTAASISCASADIQVLGRAHVDVYSWDMLGGEMPFSAPGQSLPLAILSPAGAGLVGVAPRSLFELPFHSLPGTDQPILEPDLLVGTRAMARVMAQRWARAGQGEPLVSEAGCSAGRIPLFRTREDVPGDGPVETPAAPLTDRPVPMAAPQAPDWADVNRMPTPTQPERPDWFGTKRARFTYGDLWPEPRMAPVMEQLQITGMDGFAATMPAGFLIDFDPEHGVSQTMAATGRLAENAGQFFVVAAHFRNGLYEDARAEVGPAMGAHGQTLDAPRPLSDLWWSNNLRPLILGAARASALMPGLQGMVLDLELYNAGSLAYGEGYAYDDETWGLVTAELTRLNEDAGRSAAALPLGDRMAWLVDQGLLEFAYTFLERTVAERARLIMEAARELNPTFELLLYTHALQTGWFYRGLYRGFGSSERPAVVLSYDQNTNQVFDDLQEAGYPVLGLSGILGVRLKARDAGQALYNAAVNAHGYWLFQYGDFEPLDDGAMGAPRHDPRSEYWTHFGRANTRIDTIEDGD